MKLDYKKHVEAMSWDPPYHRQFVRALFRKESNNTLHFLCRSLFADNLKFENVESLSAKLSDKEDTNPLELPCRIYLQDEQRFLVLISSSNNSHSYSLLRHSLRRSLATAIMDKNEGYCDLISIEDYLAYSVSLIDRDEETDVLYERSAYLGNKLNIENLANSTLTYSQLLFPQLTHNNRGRNYINLENFIIEGAYKMFDQAIASDNIDELLKALEFARML